MSIKSIASSVIHFVKHAAVKVSDIFVELVGHDAAAAFGHAALDVLKSAEGKIVKDAVLAVEAVKPVLSGQEKFAQVFSKVVADFKASGKDVPEQLINMLIEVAVSTVKGHFSEAGVAFDSSSQPKSA
jgi:hypothetical protein